MPWLWGIVDMEKKVSRCLGYKRAPVSACQQYGYHSFATKDMVNIARGVSGR